LTLVVHWAGAAEQTSLGLTADSGLRALGLGGEKQFGATFADRIVHPVRRRLNVDFEGF
jgi:hypothetical protein